MKGCFSVSGTGALIEELDKKLKSVDNCALLFIDVDNFKYVNDTFGHRFGDRLLKRFSEILDGLVNENCTIYRIGADKFTVLTDRFSEILEIERLAVRIIKGLKEPVEIDGRVLYRTVSIGISIYPDHGSTAEELFKNADIAVINAKETGKNRITIFNESLYTAVQEWVFIEGYLRNALKNNELELYYQPVYDMKTKRISGFEALMRWRNDEMGFVMPNQFIRVAEDTHMIIAIGEWTLRNACLFQKHLQQQGCKDIKVSVNVSRLQLLQDDFVEMVTDMLDMAGISSDSIQIEIAEPVLAGSFDMIVDKLRTLDERGLRIIMDGFGRGYSSMSLLSQLPITSLKIDRSFVNTINGTLEGTSLVDFMVHIAKSMNLRVTAEGVESREQYDHLEKIGCDALQGYFLSRPLPEREAINKLKSNTTD